MTVSALRVDFERLGERHCVYVVLFCVVQYCSQSHDQQISHVIVQCKVCQLNFIRYDMPNLDLIPLSLVVVFIASR